MPMQCVDCGKFTSKKSGVVRGLGGDFGSIIEWEVRCQPCDYKEYPPVCDVYAFETLRESLAR